MNDLKKLSEGELQEALNKHQLWLDRREGGEMANLSYTDLSHAKLFHANLEHANLFHANLSNADLLCANLRHADLNYANLRYAYLRDANLRYANLRYANLSNANLRDANLSKANLLGTGVVYECMEGMHISITPEKAFIGCQGKTHEEWSALTQEEALEMDEELGVNLWPYRDQLLSKMAEQKQQGWPKHTETEQGDKA